MSRVTRLHPRRVVGDGLSDFAPVAARVGFIGDSITAGNDTNVATSGANANVARADTPSTWAMLLSDGRWSLVVNAGVTGQRSDQIAARVTSDVLSQGVDIVVIQSCCWNDVAAGYTVAQTVANVAAMVATCRAARVLPVLCSPTPDGRSGSTTGRIQALAARIAALSDYASANGVPFIDLMTPVVDPAVGQLTTAYNNDGSVHPKAAGYKAFGAAIQPVLDGLVPPRSANLITYAGDNTDLLAGKGLFLANTAGVGTGGSYTSTSGSTASIVTDGAVVGSMQQIAAVSTSSFCLIDFAFATGWSAGDVLEMSGVMTYDGGSAVPQIRLVASGTGLPYTNTTLTVTQAVTRGRFRQRFIVPAGSTNIVFRLQLGNGTAAASVGQVAVRNRTTGALVA